jgi:hypothetical protein
MKVFARDTDELPVARVAEETTYMPTRMRQNEGVPGMTLVYKCSVELLSSSTHGAHD